MNHWSHELCAECGKAGYMHHDRLISHPFKSVEKTARELAKIMINFLDSSDPNEREKLLRAGDAVLKKYRKSN